jgi:hypothetical protein
MLSRILVLHGRIIEWENSSGALELYNDGLTASSGEHVDALLHTGRLTWKLASTEEDLKTSEQLLRKARAIASHNLPEEEEAFQEAGKLLGRLLCQNPKKSVEAYRLLEELGFTFGFSNKLTTCDLAGAGRSATQKECQGRVYVTDNVYNDRMMAHMLDLFAPNSEFWSEHNYGSPGRGFFSYQNILDNQKQRDRPRSTFEDILLHIRSRAAVGFPAVANAKYAEWWAHTRPHSNGHQLHFDYVVGEDGVSPRHPIMSSISFIDASCGGPTLVLDQTMTNEITSEGFLLVPKANRLACFNGKLLHCVLPGAGVVPGGDNRKRRLTFMVAFWNKDPRAPPMPNANSKHTGLQRLKWPVKFGETVASKLPNSCQKRCNVTPSETNVRYIDCVFQSVKHPVGSKKRKRMTIKPGIDLLGDDVFSFFGSLDSGLVVARSGVCSLNCGGKCPACLKDANGDLSMIN